MTEGQESAPHTTPSLRADSTVPPATAALWQQGEARLYPAITTRPDLYQRVVTLVRLTVDHLRGLGPTTGALLAAAQRGPELVSDVLAENGLSAYEIDVELVSQAAFAMRHREVAAEQAASARLRLVAAAHREGQLWVVLDERGHPQGDPFVPYTRLEVEVATGFGLLVTAAADADYRGVEHNVEPVRLDLRTGVVEAAPDAGVAATSHPSATAREEHAAAVREQVSGA